MVNDGYDSGFSVNKDKLRGNCKLIINDLKGIIDSNRELLFNACKVDVGNNNGFMVDFDVCNRIFNRVLSEEYCYGDVSISKRNDDVVYGKQIMDIGTVVIVSDGNFYVSLEMILRCIIVGNGLILVNHGYMYGVNNLLIVLTRELLDKYGVRDLVNMVVCDDYSYVLDKYSNIDLVIAVGDHELQLEVLKKSKSKCIVSGYEYFDIYVDDCSMIDLLDNIVNFGINIRLYVKDDCDFNYDSVIVCDVDEAIGMINFNGSGFSSCILTSSRENASRFIKEVRSMNVLVNCNPSIERVMDIKQDILINEKVIIYPFSFSLDGYSEFNI